MFQNNTIEQAVDNEFACYYAADELPARIDTAFLSDVLPKLAWASAIRLRRAVGDVQLATLVATLRQASADATHPLITTISDATLIEWRDEAEDWQTLQQILMHIATYLEQPDERPQ